MYKLYELLYNLLEANNMVHKSSKVKLKKKHKTFTDKMFNNNRKKRKEIMIRFYKYIIIIHISYRGKTAIMCEIKIGGKRIIYNRKKRNKVKSIYCNILKRNLNLKNNDKMYRLKGF